MIRKIPKQTTIRGKIYAYAYKVGFTVVTQSDGLYYIFDRHVGYTTHKNLTMDDVVRIVTDTMYASMYRNNPSLLKAWNWEDRLSQPILSAWQGGP